MQITKYQRTIDKALILLRVDGPIQSKCRIRFCLGSEKVNGLLSMKKCLQSRLKINKISLITA